MYTYTFIAYRNNEKATTANINKIMLLLIELAKIPLTETVNEIYVLDTSVYIYLIYRIKQLTLL